MTKHVLVTGANGFIGSHIVQQLLQSGHRVTGAVRDPSDMARNGHLFELHGADGNLQLTSLDLQSDNPVGDAVNGPDYVIHTASPFTLDVKDPKADLLEPAVQGVENLLKSAAKSKTIQRVVMTSSLAAVTDQPINGQMLTENDWNKTSSLSRNPYYYSKTMAERAAWDFVEGRALAWDLVVINPYMTVGPPLDPGLNQSNALFVNIATGKMPAIMPLNFGFVDVRDIAAAHIKAMSTGDAVGRYLCVAEKRTMRQVVDLMRSESFGADKLPTRSWEGWFGRKIAHLITYTIPKGTGTYLRTNFGRSADISTKKVRSDLGMKFRPVDETLRETFASLKPLPST